MDSFKHAMMASVFVASILTAPVVWPQSTMDRESVGPYITGSYGGYKSHGGDFEDENDLLGVGLGYQFNPVLGAEAEYIDFGNFGNDRVEGKLKGLSVAATARLPLSNSFAVYGKAGVFASALDVDAFNEDETYDDISPFVGAGVDFRVTPRLSAFAEYDHYNVEIDESDFNGQVNNDGPEFDTGRVGLKYQF